MNPPAFSQDLVVVGKLGEGSFSDVFEVRSKSTGQVFAVKRMKENYKTLEEVKQLPEILTLTELRSCPFVVNLHDVLFDFQHHSLALVFEKLDMNLYEFLCREKCGIPEKPTLLIIYQILRALQQMHSLFLFHRDMKPENCMINPRTMEVKVVDLGSTRRSSARGPFTEYVSTRWYRAPEILLTSGSYGPSVDIWAVGCMLYELLENRPLFPGRDELDQISRIHALCGTPTREVMNMFMQNPNTQIEMSFPIRRRQHIQHFMRNASFLTADLLDDMLTYNPLDRITVDQCIQHPVFKELNQMYDNWEMMNRPVPFSIFVINGPPEPVMKPMVVNGELISGEDEIVNAIAENNRRKIEEEKKLKIKKKAEQAKIKNELSQSRKEAIKRIKAYNKIHQNNTNVVARKTVRRNPLPFKGSILRKTQALPKVLNFKAV